MSQTMLQEMIRGGESERVEFKSGAVSPETVARGVCAFLNSDGGTILIGVKEDGHIVGVSDAEQRARAIEEELVAAISPRATWDVVVEHVDDTAVVAVVVPPGSSPPYVCDGTIYVRRGVEKVRASAEEIRQLIGKQAAQPTRWERLPASGLQLEDLDRDQVDTTVESAARDRFMNFRDAADISSVLSELGLMEFGRLTNASLVLFARNPAPRLPQIRVRATVFSTDKGGDFVDNRVLEGHLFTIFESLAAFLKLHISVGSTFEAAKFERHDKPAFPFAALREGLINALAHRDYSFYGGGMALGIYPDRIEIWNSGRLPDGLMPKDLKLPHPSLPPNPDIAHVLYLRRLIERVGRGTIKIIEECRAAGLREPKWTQTAHGVTLTIFGHAAGQVKKAKEGRLNARQERLLREMVSGEVITLGRYSEMVAAEAAKRTARRDLDQLVDAGWLRREGPTRNQAYVRTEQKI